MRTPNLGTVFYWPENPPTDAADMGRFVYSELQKISIAIAALAKGHLDKSYAAPTKPREGDLMYADGTTYNPGSGQGIYAYYGAAWHFLG